MTEALLELLPDSPVYHVGMYRNPSSLIPVQYYNRLPKGNPSDVAMVLDPIIASCEIVLGIYASQSRDSCKVSIWNYILNSTAFHFNTVSTTHSR